MTHQCKGNKMEGKDDLGESTSEGDRKKQKCRRSKETRNTPISIEILNDDVLAEIFSYFPLMDLITLEQVSRRWEQVIKFSYQRFKIIDNSKYTKIVEEKYLEIVLQRVGQYLTHLKWTESSEVTNRDMYRLVDMYCTNLEHLQLTIFSQFCDVGYITKYIAEKLKSFHINHWCASDHELSTMLKKTKSLIDFSIQGSKKFEGSSLSHLPETCQTLSLGKCSYLNIEFLPSALQYLCNLKNLYISNCIFISPSTLHPVSNQLTSLKIANDEIIHHYNNINCFEMISFPNLRVLNVTDKTLTNRDIKNIVEKCPLLEDLTLTVSKSVDSEGFRQLANLKNLIYLDVSRTNIKLDALLHITLMSGKFKKIKCNNCVHLTQEGLLQLIDYDPDLEYLKVGPFKKLESSFFTSALKSVENRSNLKSLMIEVSCGYHFVEVKEAQRLNLIELKNQPLKCNGFKIKFDCKKFAVEQDEFWYVNCNSVNESK